MNRRCLEVRIADSAVNFYLGTALVLAAGLDGIRRELKPGEPVNIDTYKMTDARPGATSASTGCRGRSARRSRVRATASSPAAVLGAELHAFLRAAQAGRVAGVQHRRQRVGAARYLRLW